MRRKALKSYFSNSGKEKPNQQQLQRQLEREAVLPLPTAEGRSNRISHGSPRDCTSELGGEPAPVAWLIPSLLTEALSEVIHPQGNCWAGNCPRAECLAVGKAGTGYPALTEPPYLTARVFMV